MFIPFLYKVLSSGFWTPIELDGLGLWLDALDTDTITFNGNNVEIWADKSGNANDVTQASAGNQPFYNTTTNTLEFVNGDNLRKNLQFNCLGSEGQHTLMMVHEVLDVATSTAGFVNIFENYSDGLDERRPLVFYRQSTDKLTHSTSGPSGASNSCEVDNASLFAGNRILGMMQTSGNNMFYIDGVIEKNISAVAGTTTSSERIRVGDLSNQNLTVKVREVILIPRAVDQGERELLEGYLAWKWSLVGNLPVNHPYKNDGSLFGFGIFSLDFSQSKNSQYLPAI